MIPDRAKPPTPAQLANLWAKTEGAAWEPPSLRHTSVVALIEGGWVKVCTMRCGFEASDTGLQWTDAARAYFAAAEPDRTQDTALSPSEVQPAGLGEAIEAPENGEQDPEWRAIRRAIDQFVGRVPVLTKHRAVHNSMLAETVARLDAAGDREAADTIVWLCWFRAIDRERERFLLSDAAERATDRHAEGRIAGLEEAKAIALEEAGTQTWGTEEPESIVEWRRGYIAACEVLYAAIRTLANGERA